MARPRLVLFALFCGPLAAQTSITVTRFASGTVAANTLVQINSSGVATCVSGPCDGVALTGGTSTALVQVAISGTVQITSNSTSGTVGNVAILTGSLGYVADSTYSDPSSGSLYGSVLVGKILASSASPPLYTVQLFGPGLYGSRVQVSSTAPGTCSGPGLIYVVPNATSSAAQIFTSSVSGMSCTWIPSGLGLDSSATPADTQIATFTVSSGLGGLGLTNSSVTADSTGDVNGNGTANFSIVKSGNASATGSVYLNNMAGTYSLQVTPVADPTANNTFSLPNITDTAAGLGLNSNTQNMAGTTYGAYSGSTFIPNVWTSTGTGTAGASNGVIITPGGTGTDASVGCKPSGAPPDSQCAVSVSGSGRPGPVSGNGTSVTVIPRLLGLAGGNTTGTSGTVGGTGGDVAVQAGSGGTAGGTSVAGSGGNVDLVIGNQGGGGGSPGTPGQLKVELAAAGTPTLVYGVSYQGLPELLVGSSVSGATISPVSPITHVTSTTTITNITVPAVCATSGFGCQITLIADAGFSTATGGNIASPSTVVISKALLLTYDSAASKWYPIY